MAFISIIQNRVIISGNMMLEVNLRDFEALDQLKKRLEQTAIVDVQDEQLRDGRVYCRIRMEATE